MSRFTQLLSDLLTLLSFTDDCKRKQNMIFAMPRTRGGSFVDSCTLLSDFRGPPRVGTYVTFGSLLGPGVGPETICLRCGLYRGRKKGL